jgi:hypothetical protein
MLQGRVGVMYRGMSKAEYYTAYLMTLRARAIQLSDRLVAGKPSYYQLVTQPETKYSKTVCDTLEQALQAYDRVYVQGIDFVLLQAVYVGSGGIGEVFVNIMLYDRLA